MKGLTWLRVTWPKRSKHQVDGDSTGLYMLPSHKQQQNWAKWTAVTFWPWIQHPAPPSPVMEPSVAAGGITIYPEGKCDYSEFPDLCEKEGSGVAWRPPAGLLGARTKMAACHRKGASFCPGDWQVWPWSLEENVLLLKKQACLWKAKKARNGQL